MPTLTARGYRGRGGGRASYIEVPPEFQATSVQTCGLWPFSIGSGWPTLGTPLGRDLRFGRSLCFDEQTWFAIAKLLLNPSSMTLGLPGLGKSTLSRRAVIGAVAAGIIPLIAGDLKGEYLDLMRSFKGGQVISLGRGRGSINILDQWALEDAARRIGGREGERLREEAHGRRLLILRGMLAIVRGGRTTIDEDTILSAALRLLSKRWRAARKRNAYLPSDLVALLEEAPDELHAAALSRGNLTRYNDLVDPLHRTLLGFIDGPLGDMFARPTTERIRVDAVGVCLDISSIPESDTTASAAALLACWNEAYSVVEAANALADAGLIAQRNFQLILDELWRPLRIGEGAVDRVNATTRLNRNDGVSVRYITHSIADMRAMDNAADREKARGFVERAGALLVGGLPRRELNELDEIVAFTEVEKQMISRWTTPPGWKVGVEPPGMGLFMLKVGSRPGIPFKVELTPAERGGFNNTNQRWAMSGDERR